MINEDVVHCRCKDFEAYKRMFADAGYHAIHRALQAGLPITHLENNQIITEYPDGRKEVIGTVPPRRGCKKKVYKWPPR